MSNYFFRNSTRKFTELSILMDSPKPWGCRVCKLDCCGREKFDQLSPLNDQEFRNYFVKHIEEFDPFITHFDRVRTIWKDEGLSVPNATDAGALERYFSNLKGCSERVMKTRMSCVFNLTSRTFYEGQRQAQIMDYRRNRVNFYFSTQKILTEIRMR